jgi:hypothetical protein
MAELNTGGAESFGIRHTCPPRWAVAECRVASGVGNQRPRRAAEWDHRLKIRPFRSGWDRFCRSKRILGTFRIDSQWCEAEQLATLGHLREERAFNDRQPASTNTVRATPNGGP